MALIPVNRGGAVDTKSITNATGGTGTITAYMNEKVVTLIFNGNFNSIGSSHTQVGSLPQGFLSPTSLYSCRVSYQNDIKYQISITSGGSIQMRAKNIDGTALTDPVTVTSYEVLTFIAKE